MTVDSGSRPPEVWNLPNCGAKVRGHGGEPLFLFFPFFRLFFFLFSCVRTVLPGKKYPENRGSQDIWQKIRAHHKFTTRISGYCLPGTSTRVFRLSVARSNVGGGRSFEARKYRGMDYGKTNTGMAKKFGRNPIKWSFCISPSPFVFVYFLPVTSIVVQ